MLVVSECCYGEASKVGEGHSIDEEGECKVGMEGREGDTGRGVEQMGREGGAPVEDWGLMARGADWSTMVGEHTWLYPERDGSCIDAGYETVQIGEIVVDGLSLDERRRRRESELTLMTAR